MNALLNVLAERAAGRMDDTGVAKVASLYTMLHAGEEEKVADAASTVGARVLEMLGKGIEHAVAPLALSLGITGAAAGGRALYDHATKGRDLDRILKEYPHLKEYEPHDIELAYNSMRHMNPHVAKDPLTGGTLLGQMLRSRDPMNPKALRFEPDLALNLMRLAPKEERVFEEAARDAAMRGMDSGLRSVAEDRKMDLQHKFQTTMEKGRRELEEARDKARALENDDARKYDEKKTKDDRRWRTDQGSLELRRKSYLEGEKSTLARERAKEQHGWKREDDHTMRNWDLEKALFSARVGRAGPDAEPLMDPSNPSMPWLDPSGAQYYDTPSISDVIRRHRPRLP